MTKELSDWERAQLHKMDEDDKRFHKSAEGRRLAAALDAEIDAQVAEEQRQLEEQNLRARGVAVRIEAVDPTVSHRSSSVKVGDEELTYGPGSDFSWFRDRFLDFAYSTPMVPSRNAADTPRAVRDRLLRNQEQMAYLARRGTDDERALLRGYYREKNRPFHGTVSDHSKRDYLDLAHFERRDVSTASGSMGDFAPPVYILERWALYRTAASPVASQAGQGDLPATGMTVNIPQVTGAVTMGVQASENTSVSNPSPTATQTGTPVQTAAAVLQVSQQELDRAGPGVNIDDVFTELGARQAATTIDTAAITAVFTTPAATITNSNSPSITALWEDVARAKSIIATTEGTRLQATHAILPPLNSAWFQAQVGTDGRPVWMPSPAATLGRVGAANTIFEGYEGYDIVGLETFQDANLPAGGASAGYATVLVGDLPNGLLVLTGTPIVDIWPEFSPTTLTCAVSIRQYFALAVLYPSGFVQLTGPAYVLTPVFTGS